MSVPVDFSKKSLVLVTGASQGIGRTIALEVSKTLPPNSILVLLARSSEKLQETKQLILQLGRSLDVFTEQIDLSRANNKALESIFEKIIPAINGHECGSIFHNAGSTGQVQETVNLTDVAQWQEYFHLNLFSVAALNGVFVKKIRPLIAKLVVVNITSLVGRKPFENLGMYGAGKAGREIFFKVFALEEPQVVVLNYSPGPVDTEMFEGIIQGAQSEAVRTSFSQVKKDGILTTEQTVSKMLEILGKGDFASGDTIDYFDRP